MTLLMATMTEPHLLVDEHTAALYSVMVKKVLTLTGEIADQHRLCTIRVTHNMKAALEYGSRTLMMH